MEMGFSAAELRMCKTIREKDSRLRALLRERRLSGVVDPLDWLGYLSAAKAVLGNLSNDIGFVATLLVKRYLASRFGIADFDAAAKAQGAAGIDIDARTADGETIAGELKTTTPYQPGFGAQQREMMIKDMVRLASSPAHHRFMFVTDPETFTALCKPTWAVRAPGVSIVDLVTGRAFTCPRGAPPEARLHTTPAN